VLAEESLREQLTGNEFLGAETKPDSRPVAATSPGGARQKKEAADRRLGCDEKELEAVGRTESKTEKSFDATDETGGLVSARKQRR
jgi:hypothetical protein